jgi:DNA ligase (NAD+)
MKDVSVLEDKIRHLRKSYYNGEPEVSDAAFDLLINELESLNPESDVLKKEVGAFFSEEHFVKEKHIIPMGSLDKVNTEEGIINWITKYKHEGKGYLIEEKLDGFSIELVYKEGKLVNAITRGDGIQGEDILRNVMRMHNVSTNLPIKIDCSLRGEIILTKKNFEKYFASEMSNPRNAAAGIAKRLTGEGNEHLSVLFYDILFHSKENKIKTELDKLAFIVDELHLATTNVAHANTYTEIINYWNDYKDEKRNSLPYLIDGLVIKVNDLEKQKEYDKIGEMKPKSQIAVKFENEAGTTKLESVEWFVGRSGIVTPLAHLTPVEIEGRVFSKASLCNCDELKRLNIGLGDTVIVEVCGDVIPKVTEVVEFNSSEKIIVPSHCPSCKSELKLFGPRLYCENKECEEKNIKKIIYWIEKTEIEFVGEETVRQMYKAGLIRDPADLYSLTKDDILGLERKGEKSATKIIENIQKSKNLSLITFIAAIGIEMLGTKLMKTITDVYGTDLKNLLNLSIDDLIKIEGISETKATAFVNGFKEESPFISKLLSKGITLMTPTEKTNTNQPDLGNFCITGTCTIINPNTEKRYTRNDLEAIIRSRGGNISTVNKSLNYLIVFEDPGSKVVKAAKLGVKMLNQEEFAEMFLE